MKVFAAKKAKDSFGLLLDTAQREPVTIEKKGRPVAVVLSFDDYRRFEALEDEWWGKQALKAKKGGSAGVKRSAKLLDELLNAEG
jgi:prevent-host-death family protein